jgi:hypothetical protein
MNRIKPFPYHTLLLPIFFILHVVNAYYGLIQSSISLLFLGYYLLLTIGLLLLGKLIFGDFIKSGCWATFLLIIFFFFGAAHDFLKTLPLPQFITSYKFLLPLIGILFLLITLFIQRKMSVLFNTNRYLTILFTTLVLIELFILGFKGAGNDENNLSQFNKPVLDSINISSAEKPDIFFIVFDEYASSVSLKKYLDYNNYSIDSFLAANQFYIVNNSKSNYNSTPLSIGSTFNLNYFNMPLAGKTALAKLRLQSFAVIRQTELPVFLSKQGYRIYNYGLINIDGHPVYTSEFSTPFKMDVLSEETLWGRIKKDIWWNFQSADTSVLASSNKDFFERNRKNFLLTLNEMNLQSDTPKFVISHIMMPHAPFLIDSLGKKIYIGPAKNLDSLDRSLYINQLAYVNTWIKKLAVAANKNFKRPRVIIIEGDHGYRDLKITRNTISEKQFMNLNTYFFSDKDYSILYDSISPVNTFRVVLNKYFGTQLPLLKDSTILLY